MFSGSNKEYTFKTYMKWVKKSPQLMGFLNMIIADIMSDDIEFKPISSQKDKQDAEDFFRLNKGRILLEETLLDFLSLGIAYNWVGKISEKQFKEICDSVISEYKEKYNIELKAEDIANRVLTSKKKELAKKWRYIPASTVSIKTDFVKPIAYVQRVGARYNNFDPKEVITFKLTPFDGQVYPLAPMEVILSEVYLLWLISQNYVSLFENGGSPDKVFILPNELANSRNHQYLINTLKKYKKIQNKHGNLVFTGDLKIEDLVKMEDQMENKDLSLYLVGVLALYYGVPSGRVPFLIGKSANPAEGGGLADSGYWRKISVWQTKIEEALNRDLWMPFFNVEMKFKRGYKQDEVREIAVDKQKTDVVEQRMKLGLWTVDAAAEYLNIDPAEVKKAQQQQKEIEKSNLVQQNMLSNQQKMIEGDKRQNDLRKQSTQNNHLALAGGSSQNA